MKSVLIFRGGWDGHEPVQCSDVFIPWLKEQGFSVTVSDSLDVLDDADKLKEYSLIMPVWTMGKITNDQVANLAAAIESGVGLAGWHGGMCDAFRENAKYQFITGGQFVDHPGNAQKQYTVNILDRDDPLTHGIADFKFTSEQYYMHVDPGNQVIATTTFDGELYPWIDGTVMPVVWKRQWGNGKIFYSSLGHVAQEFTDFPQIKTLTQRGILWAARE